MKSVIVIVKFYGLILHTYDGGSNKNKNIFLLKDFVKFGNLLC